MRPARRPARRAPSTVTRVPSSGATSRRWSSTTRLAGQRAAARSRRVPSRIPWLGSSRSRNITPPPAGTRPDRARSRRGSDAPSRCRSVSTLAPHSRKKSSVRWASRSATMPRMPSVGAPISKECVRLVPARGGRVQPVAPHALLDPAVLGPHRPREVPAGLGGHHLGLGEPRATHHRRPPHDIVCAEVLSPEDGAQGPRLATDPGASPALRTPAARAGQVTHPGVDRGGVGVDLDRRRRLEQRAVEPGRGPCAVCSHVSLPPVRWLRGFRGHRGLRGLRAWPACGGASRSGVGAHLPGSSEVRTNDHDRR